MNLRKVLTAFAFVITVLISGHSPAFAQLFAVLLGGNEVSAVGDANAGDPDGSGTATVVFGDTTICYAILVRGIDAPTLAHIHEGAAGINGPVQVLLSPPTPALETGATSSDCVPVDAVLLNSIRLNPAGFYVNVHNDAYPDGAVRGQLF
jgi:CHRD domain